ncbi:complexin-4-like [Lissotriton helveticus]
MAFMLKKMMMGATMKNLGGDGEKKATNDGKETPQSKGLTREEFEEYQRELMEEKIERDHNFAQKKAERATVRMHMREKHRLPQSEKDESQIQMVGGEVELPQDLAKMVQDDEDEEEANGSFFGMLQDVDLDALKTKAQGTLTEVKRAAEDKCTTM